MAELWPGGPIELPHAFTLDGHELLLPDIPARQLLDWLAHGAWWQLLPQAVTFTEVVPLVLRLSDPEDYAFDYESFWAPAISLFAGLAGTRPREGAGTGWWPAVRLASLAVVQWPVFTAWCVSHGTDPLDGPLWMILGRVYGWIRDGRTAQDLAKLEQQIWAPPPITTTMSTAELPQHVRDEEAAFALQALHEAIPGAEQGAAAEWRPPDTA